MATRDDDWRGGVGPWAVRVLLAVGLAIPVSGEEPVLSESRGKHGMVVSACRLASAVGVEVLRAGGNAVDAAVAVQFALAVTWPEAGNIGGGGFMLVHPPGGGAVVCVDYRETAPGAATGTMFGPEDGRHTRKIVGVPGSVRGMEAAHRAHGELEWARLVEPAVRLAAEGFEVDESLAGSLNGVLGGAESERLNPELVRVYGKPGEDGGGRSRWEAGDRLVLPDLAETLRRISAEGAEGFYGGETARLFVAEMKRGDGLIDAADLAGYGAVIRRAIHGTYRGYDVYGPPPPSSGGIALVGMLNILETFDLRSEERFAVGNLHVIAEAMKRAYCDRARFLGDADFVEIPQRLLRKGYAKRLAGEIDPRFATPSATLAPELEVKDEGPSTTHFSIMDGAGMAVSNTTTLEANWGARIVVEGAGFVLNNEMGDFNWFPGHTDRRGRIGTEANRIAPGKRMLSSQTPVVVAYKGRPVLITGSPGGRSIINTVLQMVVNVIDFEMDLPEAMRAPRMHHPWFPDRLIHEGDERGFPASTIAALEAKGHELEAMRSGAYQGDAHSIAIDLETGERHGVADWRRGGTAVGY